MASYLKFELEDGTIVYIETTDSPKGTSGLIPGSRGADQASDHLAVSFEKSIGAVRKMASAMLEAFRTDQPDDVSINFGLKASGELGNLIVARGGTEANFNVSVRWHKEDKKEDEKAEKKEAK